MSGRRRVKEALGLLGGIGRPTGMTVLTYHRVGGGSTDELDVEPAAFEQQLDALVDAPADVVSLDDALGRLRSGDATPTIVLTFDDGFRDVRRNAFPRLAERGMPFTLYLAAGLVGGAMRWEGSSAGSQGAPAVGWEDVEEMVASGLCTVGNHTWSHARPAEVDAIELDRCSDELERRLGARPEHFAYTWGVVDPAAEPLVRARFRSAVTGRLGRNGTGVDPHRIRRIPVRRTDPARFFRAKVAGGLGGERSYAGLVRLARAAGH